MGRAEDVTRFLRKVDSKLYCEKGREGKLCVYRKSSRIEPYDVDGVIINFVRPAPFFIFALTDNWQLSGKPTDWGLDPIYFRLQEIDSWNRNLAEELIEQEEKEARIREKDLRNENEAFAKDFRKQFARTFDDVNTSTMSKIDSRRKEEKNGYCK